MKATSEEAFEVLIEHHLLEHGCYLRREAGAFDAGLAVIHQDLVGYIADTQPEVWAATSQAPGIPSGQPTPKVDSLSVASGRSSLPPSLANSTSMSQIGLTQPAKAR